MRAFLMLAAVTLTTAAAHAATSTTTGTFTGSALAYDPATDFSPFTGYSPPSQLGGFNGLITLSGFDTALGTLNSITISEQADTSLEFTQADPFGTSELLNASVFTSGVSPFGDHDIDLPYTFFNPSTIPFHTFDTGVQYNDSGPGTPFTDTTPTDFTPFLTKTIYVPVLGYVTQGPSTGSYLGQPRRRSATP